jgi:hypothetical protein
LYGSSDGHVNSLGDFLRCSCTDELLTDNYGMSVGIRGWFECMLTSYSSAMVILFQGASNIIFPIIKAEGVRQMFFPNMVPAYYKAPPPEA